MKAETIPIDSILHKVDASIVNEMHNLAKEPKNDAIKCALTTLKLIKSELVSKNDNDEYKLSVDDEENVLMDMKKKREDVIGIYKAQNRNDLATKESNELAIIIPLIPTKYSTDEVVSYEKSIVEELKIEKGESYQISMRDMKYVKEKMLEKYPKVEGKLIAATLKEIIANDSH